MTMLRSSLKKRPCHRTIFLLAIATGVALLSAPLRARAQDTPSQTNSEQLNQLFGFETTPDKSAKGEAYVSGQFRFLKYPGDFKQYLFQLQGQYSFTDQLAIGGWVPYYDTRIDGSNNGFGDLTFYGQYKLDQLVNPDVVDLTAQLDVVLPTGDRGKGEDTGKFGVRPLIEAYKDFGPAGPGSIGVYGLFGFTITGDPDVRFGLAGTYNYDQIIGIVELDDLAGDKVGKPSIEITPGVAYRGISPWELALGFPLGVNSGSPDFGVDVKLTYAFEK